jgi:hypothetical protein
MCYNEITIIFSYIYLNIHIALLYSSGYHSILPLLHRLKMYFSLKVTAIHLNREKKLV